MDYDIHYWKAKYREAKCIALDAIGTMEHFSVLENETEDFKLKISNLESDDNKNGYYHD